MPETVLESIPLSSVKIKVSPGQYIRAESTDIS